MRTAGLRIFSGSYVVGGERFPISITATRQIPELWDVVVYSPRFPDEERLMTITHNRERREWCRLLLSEVTTLVCEVVGAKTKIDQGKWTYFTT